MYFVVAQEGGASWDRSRPMREQQMWTEHAAFVDALAEEGLVVLAGPLGDSAGSRDRVHRALLVIDADSEDTVRARLAADPWIRSGMLTVVSIDRWEILLGHIARH
jgi:uncharacterized protein YciI